MWRLKSWTYWLNLILMGVSLWETSILNKSTQKIIATAAVANLLLREKTQKKLDKEK